MSETISITQGDIDQLAGALEANAVTPAAAAAAGPQDVAGIDFCNIWPSARQALVVLRTILDAVPGVGLFAKAAIGIVIAAGDAAENAFCRG
ncbi:MAG: hypothetical protein AAF414_08410 [Pseudomonadota bacterium]